MISPNGTSARVLAAAEEGHYELVLSTRLLSELEDVLRREKFRRYLPIESVPLFLSRLALAASRASGGPLPYNPPYEEGEIVPVSADPKDDYLVALAVASGASYLVSGDNHLLDLETRATGAIATPILTPREFLEQLEWSE